jgi:MFS transporter, SP family, general alpha glucoside:H+ symporter
MSSSPKMMPTEVETVQDDHVGIEYNVNKSDARDATQLEHDLTVRSAMRLYPKAIGFSLLFSTAIIMEGYDLSLLGSFYGYDAWVPPSALLFERPLTI